MICGTGLGISMASSKVTGSRVALCTNTYMAKMAREHNDANIIAIGARVTGQGVIESMLDAFLNTDFLKGRHGKRVNQLNDLDKKYFK